MKRRRFYAIRVVLREINGMTYTKDYVRHEHMGKSTFTAYAIGHFILLLNLSNAVRVEIFEIDYRTVIENRKYHHTTH